MEIFVQEVAVPALRPAQPPAVCSRVVTGSLQLMPYGFLASLFHVCILKFPREHFVGWHNVWSTDHVCLLFLSEGGADISLCIYNSYL